MRATKKPVTIEYYPLEEQYKQAILEWSTQERPIIIVSYENEPEKIYAEITTLEGVMRADYGDIIIQGVNGEIYPCKPDIFEKTYSQANEVAGVINSLFLDSPYQGKDWEAVRKELIDKLSR